MKDVERVRSAILFKLERLNHLFSPLSGSVTITAESY